MSKSRIYTKTGDQGDTSLVSGNRISKADHRIHIYGEVDELNSFIGVAFALMKKEKVADSEFIVLEEVQRSLFDFGSNLACEAKFREKYKLPLIDDETIEDLENHIDRLDSSLPVLRNFILPGGHEIAAHLHVARTVCRRIERNLVVFKGTDPEEVPDHALKFINRLSDYLFVLARYVNLKCKVEEHQWKVR